MQQFTAVYQKRGKWFVGYVEEVSGVNSQGRTMREVRDNLQEALGLVIDVNRTMLAREVRGRVIREPLKLLSA
ncbi:MAG: type II toxin-antitoxin system HicB family antitoxin [Patescibacteria group bacterium]